MVRRVALHRAQRRLDLIDRSQVVDWAVAEMLTDAELPGLVELAALSSMDPESVDPLLGRLLIDLRGHDVNEFEVGMLVVTAAHVVRASADLVDSFQEVTRARLVLLGVTAGCRE